MIGKKNLLSSLNYSYKIIIKLRDESSLEVMPKGEMEVDTKQGKKKGEIYLLCS